VRIEGVCALSVFGGGRHAGLGARDDDLRVFIEVEEHGHSVGGGWRAKDACPSQNPLRQLLRQLHTVSANALATDSASTLSTLGGTKSPSARLLLGDSGVVL
jgi:hypothetical protein